MEIFVGAVGVIMVVGLGILFLVTYAQSRKEGVRPDFTRAILTMIALAVSAYGFRLMQINLSAESIALFVMAAFFSTVLWVR